MRNSFLYALPIFLLCAGCASVGLQKDLPRTTVVIAFEDAKFVSVVPDRADSPGIAVLWGDSTTGPSAMFIRLPRGPLPMHTHSSDYHLLVVKGVLKHWSADETEADAKPLGPGSYWFQPGNEAHADSCLSDECVAYLVWSGKQDGRLAEPRKK